MTDNLLCQILIENNCDLIMNLPFSSEQRRGCHCPPDQTPASALLSAAWPPPSSSWRPPACPARVCRTVVCSVQHGERVAWEGEAPDCQLHPMPGPGADQSQSDPLSSSCRTMKGCDQQRGYIRCFRVLKLLSSTIVYCDISLFHFTNNFEEILS